MKNDARTPNLTVVFCSSREHWASHGLSSVPTGDSEQEERKKEEEEEEIKEIGKSLSENLGWWG